MLVWEVGWCMLAFFWQREESWGVKEVSRTKQKVHIKKNMSQIGICGKTNASVMLCTNKFTIHGLPRCTPSSPCGSWSHLLIFEDLQEEGGEEFRGTFHLHVQEATGVACSDHPQVCDFHQQLGPEVRDVVLAIVDVVLKRQQVLLLAILDLLHTRQTWTICAKKEWNNPFILFYFLLFNSVLFYIIFSIFYVFHYILLIYIIFDILCYCFIWFNNILHFYVIFYLIYYILFDNWQVLNDIRVTKQK